MFFRVTEAVEAEAAVSRALRALNRMERAEAARQHVAVADIFTVSREPTDPSPDGLHPSARELEAWTDAIEPVARRVWPSPTPG
jgi:lysophospholipase L1-like esterase